MKRRRRTPRASSGLVVLNDHGIKRTLFTCERCGDGFTSHDSRKVAAWAIRHLNAHLRTAVDRQPAEVDE